MRSTMYLLWHLMRIVIRHYRAPATFSKLQRSPICRHRGQIHSFQVKFDPPRGLLTRRICQDIKVGGVTLTSLREGHRESLLNFQTSLLALWANANVPGIFTYRDVPKIRRSFLVREWVLNVEPRRRLVAKLFAGSPLSSYRR